MTDRSLVLVGDRYVTSVASGGRQLTPGQQSTLSIERFCAQSEGRLHVESYATVDTQPLDAWINLAILNWDAMYKELTKLHHERKAHGNINTNTVITTDTSRILFTGFYGAKDIPANSETVRKDTVDLFAVLRARFMCDLHENMTDPKRVPLKHFLDEMAHHLDEPQWLTRFSDAHAKLVHTTFTAQLSPMTYEGLFSIHRTKCVIKFTSAVEVDAYRTLSQGNVCPKLIFSARDTLIGGEFFQNYICYAKLKNERLLNHITVNTVILAFSQLSTMHFYNIAHLNIQAKNLLVHSVDLLCKSKELAQRVLFTNFEHARTLGFSEGASLELSDAPHSLELRLNPKNSKLLKKDDVFALAVTLLSCLTDTPYHEPRSKDVRVFYTEVKQQFQHHMTPLAHTLCTALCEERPSAEGMVALLKKLKEK